MKLNEEKMSGGAIIIGCLAVIVTMVLHPVGGSFEHLMRIARVVVVTHALAVAGLIVMLAGFMGVAKRLNGEPFLANSGLAAFSVGSVAAMCAAVINGLALPAFVGHYAESDTTTQEAVRLVLFYGHTLNAGFARVYMGATAAAVLTWSIAILLTGAMSRWSGFVGVFAGIAGLIMIFVGIAGVDVHRFGLFVFAFSAWAILIALQLVRTK